MNETTSTRPTRTPRTSGDIATISRRRLLVGAAAIGTTAALGSFGSRAAATTTPGSARSTSATAPATLVIVTLYGGNDALNTVTPIADPLYGRLRGALALEPTTVHDIGDGFALHPALTSTKELWDQDRLAIVHGVGFDGLDRSHFHCMDVWQAGAEHDMSTGWIGRWLDAIGTDPLDAIAVGNDLPLLLRGAHRSAAVVPDGPFDLPGDEQLATLLATLNAADSERPPLAATVAASTSDLLAIVDRLSPLLTSAGSEATDDDSASDGEGGDVQGSDLRTRLDTVATLIEADLPPRLYSVDLRGFDTHAGQAPTHAALLGQLDGALGAFVERIGERPVTVAVYSEFGRRVAPNASGGTDHGRGGTMLVAGRVRAGHHGDPPPLDALIDGDLATTTDFRAVLGGLLEGVLGIDGGDVLDGAPAPLALV